MASLLLLPPKEYWIKLLEEARPEIIGGLFVAVVLGVAAFLWKKFGKRPSDQQTAPPEVRVKVEAVPPQQPNPPVPHGAGAKSRSYVPRPPLAGFVARRDENGRDIVERLKDELAPAKEQLIVLWGAGGVGKTTLAAETARAMRDVFEGGIIWTSADGKPDYSLSTLLDEIATHLQRPELRQLALQPKEEEVHFALSRTPIPLIVLDNLETVPREERSKCAEWLANRASCPALITSRTEVSHARPVRLLAMSLPEAREFLGRLISEAHNSHIFEKLDHEQIIQTADRIPLVLQWVVKQIDAAKQPQAVLDGLSHGEGDAAKRVFDRSFDLAQVGDDGRATLLALSLFTPGASREALAEVAGFGNDIERLERAAQQLLDLWLIQISDEMYRVEGLTRELTKTRLQKEEGVIAYKRRFVAYFREYAEAHAEPNPENYELLELVKDNLLNAIDIAFELEDWPSVQAFASAIALPINGMLSVRGYWADALKINEQALEASQYSESQIEVSVFAHNLAMMYSYRGDLVKARSLYNKSLAIERKLDDQRGISITLHELAVLSHEEGDLAEAHRLFNESLEIERKLGAESGIAASLHELARLALKQGELAEAHRLYNEALEIRKKLHDTRGIAITLHELARVAQIQGELVEARRVYNESLEIKKMLGDQSGIASTLGQLGQLAETEGNLKEAARLYGEALVIFDRLKSPYADIARRNLERLKSKSD